MSDYRDIPLKYILFSLFIKIFSYPWFQLFISLLCTVVISVMTLNYETSNKTTWWRTLIISCVIYLIIELLIVYANNKKQKLRKYSVIMEKCLEGHISICANIANMFYSLSKEIRKVVLTKDKLQMSTLNKIAGFQRISFLICSDILNILSKELNCNECQVTVFKRFNSNGRKYIQMIAYQNSKKDIPASYPEKYDLYSKAKTKPLMVKIFEKNDNEAVKLATREAVKKEFKIFDQSKSREENICQYIGVPIRSADNQISVVLQIDVSSEFVLGKNISEMEQFNCDILASYCKLLHAAYEQESIYDIFYEVYEKHVITNGAELVESR